MNATNSANEKNDATSDTTARELCRALGVDPERFWGVVSDYLCDAHFQGTRDAKAESIRKAA